MRAHTRNPDTVRKVFLCLNSFKKFKNYIYIYIDTYTEFDCVRISVETNDKSYFYFFFLLVPHLRVRGEIQSLNGINRQSGCTRCLTGVTRDDYLLTSINQYTAWNRRRVIIIIIIIFICILSIRFVRINLQWAKYGAELHTCDLNLYSQSHSRMNLYRFGNKKIYKFVVHAFDFHVSMSHDDRLRV